jgi:S-formylglutathione hydrolase FrmB
MKRISTKILTLFFLFTTSVLMAQISHGTVRESLTMESKILHKTVRYTIYLPFDYNTSQRSYPVVYLLHGYSDNDIGWTQFGEDNFIADHEIASGKIPPMILVTPDAGTSWYINNYDGSVRYEDFFFKEFIPYIESHYRIRTGKSFRAVAGLSMGGYGALVYAMKHPDMFVACAALSAAVRTDKQIINLSPERWKVIESLVYGPDLKGKARLTKLLIDNDPVHIIQTADLSKLKKVKYYFDCGDNDHVTIGNSTMHILMTQRHIPHTFIMRPGRHNWEYWRSGLPDALEFIGKAFIH